jgi:hypothetical protein
LLQRADWRERTSEFGNVVAVSDAIAMEFEPHESYRTVDWYRLQHQWFLLPRTPHILEVLEPAHGTKALLRYASIAWNLKSIKLSAGPATRKVFATSVYDKATELSTELRQRALRGKARAFLAIDRAADAIATIDQLGANLDLEALELRGLAAARLGLAADADRDMGRVVAESGSRSDLRLGKRP